MSLRAQIKKKSSGAMLRHYTYDGLGRLIRTTSPDNFTNRVEHHYYDGVRRIQTVVVSREYVWGPGDRGVGEHAFLQDDPTACFFAPWAGSASGTARRVAHWFPEPRPDWSA